jgi:predicted component of type VI protein secretion system
MRLKYYTLPLDPELLMQKKEHPGCTLKQSVAHHLHLIITTAFGEMQSDADYGNSIWDHDFDNLTTRIKQQEWMKDSLLAAIKKHERRLDHVKADVLVKQEEVNDATAERRIKKRLDINITGRLTATSEDITFRDSFFVSPLAYS